MRTIPLTQGRVALVDDEDFEALSRWKWTLNRRSRNKAYAVRCESRGGRKSMILMHRQILGLVPGDGLQADHVNRDKLDNRRCNLRIATPSEQLCNQISRGGASRYKGVSLDRRDGAWYAHITVNSRCLHLGRFVCDADAATAYDEAARALHGEFAVLNFPEVMS